MERIAQCQCGSLRAHASGEPYRVNVCHCKACQRRTGAVFHCGAFFAKAQVRIEGASKVYARRADSGRTVRFYFCPNCGSTVYYENDVLTDHYGIAVGAFADPTFPAPTYSVWGEARHSWICLPPDVQNFEQGRPGSSAPAQGLAD